MLGVLTPACAKKIARRLAATVPHRYTLSSDPGKRTGRIFVDYLWNGRGTTATGAWSPRARAGFPIAAPVSWHQVENGIRPDGFTTRSAIALAASVVSGPGGSCRLLTKFRGAKPSP